MNPPKGVRLLGRGLTHPEGVAYDSHGGIYTGIAAPDHVGRGPLVHIDAETGGHRVVADTGGRILGIATDQRDHAYVCDSQAGAVLRISPDGGITTVTQGTVGRRLIMPNFCVFDPDGVLYISDSGTAAAGEPTGAVFRHRPDGQTDLLVDGLIFANGLAHDRRADVLYIVETRDDRVLRLDLGSMTARPEVYADRLASGPDGLALDGNGDLYVTLTRTHRIVRVHDGGQQVVAEDPDGQWLNMPSNLAFHPDGRPEAIVANLFGHHLTSIPVPVGGSRPTQGPPS